MKTNLQRGRQWLETSIAAPGDTAGDRQRKLVAIGSHAAGILATGFWAGILARLGLTALGGLLFAMFVILSLDLLYLFATRRFRVFLNIELLVALLNPFVAQFLLGGFARSGFVSLWALTCIMGAAIYLDRQSAYRWLVAYAALTIISAVLEGTAQTLAPQIPAGVRTIIFAWNGVFIGALLFLAVQTTLRETELARDQADRLLLNILPRDIAAILKTEQRVIADHYDEATVLFADMVSFTPMSAEMTPVEMVELLNEIFSHFDQLVEQYDVEKIKTVGDCYMVAAGVPRPRSDHAQVLAHLALDMRAYLQRSVFKASRPVDFKIGLNSGAVLAGVIGRKKFIYDLWGDAVNTASRMESHGAGGLIQITQATYALIKNDFVCELRGTIDVKGKGDMQVWNVVGANPPPDSAAPAGAVFSSE